ncbi:D-alanyl-D-alanine carboxypeptidase / D-alanyl-D-alanine-endopeptidase (penicillin-binding protein 4) [Leifsonia sp. 98AMF]|uniref:D-alanyl-D-alanine carboxypeptidase/D-alanyl-D-alanine-endopeptidase n=1 Tax=unclassified Leifsonia TaxID=2663824 RepID=UPI00087BA92D|nr:MULTISPECIES: D-alanyl-D-alanine carboxypeptidase [unclassified Leifsonia]SDH16429.1 D-alanyl-D-alanine carboxypeptidase / D-alanyl-D-alanine-endopeptidase (penicillin-binding protein 4) [Leifsonia sp. 197AMF]SDJ21867.1 D-alanyl-D-alanine carboxypeptidase / D-alanyl-D-alanine-endopeptidase (penicillin-binding protein 4) [Leifsonia sp. 466MF]SDJ42853.1 D-alanyl-D-alanine carboxypeptidase / D-alanyl-D-alanine-endopeptidase (penicillin-binding protein 4) [Leifsonia sp. 157MF]SDN43537.1 D-alanyl
MHESDQPVTGPDPSNLPTTPTPLADSSAGSEPPATTGSGRRAAARPAKAAGLSGVAAGVLATIRKHPKTWMAAAAAVVFLLLGGGSVALGATVGSPAAAAGPVSSATPSPTRTATATPTPTPTVDPARPVPANQAAATRIRTCSVAGLAADGRLGNLEAQVVNAKTGQTLFDRNGVKPGPTASVLKTLTSAAALATLGPDYRVSTTVVAGSTPGQVVIVGGGDVTLSRLPDGQASFYTGAPKIQDLANQVKQAMGGQQITSIVVDATLFGAPFWQPSWDEREERVVEGSTPYMTALMVDGDRDDPTAVESPRSTDPVGRAVQYFQQYLGTNVGVSQGVAPAGARQLGVVQSQPVTTLIDQAMRVSDNTIMEELARLVAIKNGAGNTFDALNAGVLAGLKGYGIDASGIHIADGSGLSGDNAVPPSYLTQLFIKVLNRQNGLGVVYDGLPVAGQSGTLGPGYNRFTGANSVARGAVFAKTGWIDNGYTLSGIINAADGTPLTFAVFALGPVSDNAKQAIDTLVTGFYKCGDNLSNG